MRRFLVLLLAVGAGAVLGRMFDGVSSMAEAGGGKGAGEAECAGQNGDVNADGEVDVADCMTILRHLFFPNPKELVPLCTAPAAPSGLPHTGQTTCYDTNGQVVDCAGDTCAGQDGFYGTGCSSDGRFVDNGDGTVTDNCTGLMWQKDTGNDEGAVSWCEALAYCENVELAGHQDWRLPTVRELQSIVDYGRTRTAIDPLFGARSNPYWSSTSSEELASRAWRVNFLDGSVNPTTKDSGGFVRAVRSGL